MAPSLCCGLDAIPRWEAGATAQDCCHSLTEFQCLNTVVSHAFFVFVVSGGQVDLVPASFGDSLNSGIKGFDL